ncbi:MAG: hypothetical protein ACOYK7_15900 [Pirellulales bacterium]
MSSLRRRTLLLAMVAGIMTLVAAEAAPTPSRRVCGPRTAIVEIERGKDGAADRVVWRYDGTQEEVNSIQKTAAQQTNGVLCHRVGQFQWSSR